MSKVSKRFSGIIKDVTARWQETLSSTAEPDLDGAVKLLHKAMPHRPQIFAVKSPIEFYIAQAVLRGRVSKKAAVEMADKIEIDPGFVKQLTRLGGPRRVTASIGRWNGPELTTNILLGVTERQFHNHIVEMPPAADTQQIPRNRAIVQLQCLHDLYLHLLPRPNSSTTPKEVMQDVNHRDWRLNFYSAQNHVSHSIVTIYEAVSGKPDDILNGFFHPRNHRNDAIQAEIICRAIGCKDPSVTWLFEILHRVPAFMQFDNAYLILAGKPAMSLDSAGNLHNTTGPAVVWPDGKKQWFVDGHVLNQCGEKIVMQPENLTKDEIFSISNEEERRIAIDRMGWHKYLTAIDAKIMDNRENWVDNTFEVLIAPPVKVQMSFQREEPLRMVLSCRSTGRKYFIAVPRALPNPAWANAWPDANEQRLNPPISIKNCADAQKWLADGATTHYLDFAKHPLNIVGAS